MKKSLLILSAFFALQLAAQPVALQWAKSLSGTNTTYASSMTTDASGNVITCGQFTGTVDFDPGAGVFNLTAAGGTDAFISKLDANGNFVWAAAFNGPDTEYGTSIVCDAAGNIYCGGNFWATTDFDPGPGTYNMTSIGFDDAFIVKLTPAGTLVFAKQIGGTVGGDRCYACTLDPSGNIYMTGGFKQTVDFDPGPGTYLLTGTGVNNEIYIEKLDNSGGFLWAKAIGSSYDDIGQAIAASSSEVIVTGYYQGTVDFDPGAGLYPLNSNGTSIDGFVVTLSSAGAFMWAGSYGGLGTDAGYAISQIGGDAYVAGSFQGIADLDPTGGVYNRTTNGGDDVFLLKIRTVGSFYWATSFGGAGSDFAYAVNYSASYAYVAGGFMATMDMDPGPNVENRTSNGSTDLFVGCYNSSNASFAWGYGLGSGGNEYAMSLSASTASSTVHYAGWYQNTVDFDPNAGVVNLTATGTSGAFISKISTVRGAALNFDGINDYLVTTSTPLYSDLGLGSFTMEAWINPTSLTGHRSIIRHDADYNLFLFNGVLNAEAFTTGGSGGPYINTQSTVTVSASTWTHVAAAWNGSSFRLYINGIDVTGSTTGGSAFPTSSLCVGGSVPYGQYFEGSLDEVRIWNRALCQAEILNNMNCEIATSASGLLVNYHFNQGTANANNAGVNPVLDASGNNISGVATNFALNGTISNWIAPGAVTTGISCGAFTPPSVTVNVLSQTNVSCFGGSNGAAGVSASGGSGFTYDWTPGNPTGDGTASVTGLTFGTWTCTVTNDCGGTGTSTFNITQPSALSVTAASQTNISCNGGSNGAASINTPTGGAGGYTYNWTPGNPTGDGTVSVTGLTFGTWTCTVTDANSCVTTQTFNITQPTALVATAASQTNVSCNGGSNGAASINTPTGGTPGYTYNWTPGNPTGDGTVSVTGLTFGTWTCTVTDANSCVTTQTFNITQPTALSVTAASQTNISCNGGSNGAASINTPTGGTPGYTYNWTPGNPTGDGTVSVTGLTFGTWTCTVTDANSCATTRTFNITQPPALVATAASQTNVSCNGGSNGAASINTPTGGTPGYTYNWTPGNPTGDGTVSVTGLTFGTWTCTVTDANSCVTTQTFNITAPTALVVTPASQTNVSCNAGSNGAASINTPTGGTPGYTYNWTPGNPTGDGTVSVTGLTSGTWTCTVTDANSCVTTQTFNITQPPALVATAASQTNVSCNGGSNGAASINTPTGGTPGYTYNWTPGNPTGDGTVSVTGLTFGTWTCTVTDANSCVTTRTFNITQPIALSVSGTTTGVSCNAGSNGSASTSTSGGTSPYSYSWAPSGGTAATATGLSAATYTCTITDANSCVTTVTLVVTEPTALTSTSSVTDVTCFAANDGSSTVTPTGGTSPYTYAWSPSGGSNATATGLDGGLYTCTITDANGCIIVENITVNEPSLLTATTMQTNVSCNGGANGDAMVMASGGTSPYTYSWAPSGGTGSTASGLTAGLYTCTITDANGCTNAQTFNVTEPGVLLSSSSATSILCNGGTATVTVSGSGGISPYTGTGTFTVTAGTYTYTVTDANSCTSTTTITVTEPTALAASSSATSIACNGGNATVTVVGTGGTAPYSGDGTFTVAAGTYTYTVTDANGCTSATSITITEPTAISTSVVAVNVDCNGNSTGSIDLTVSGGTAPYTFDWNSGTYTTEDLTGLGAGTYIGVLTDANGCTDSGTIVISEPAVLVASPTTATDPTTCSGTDGSIDITVSGGTTGYSFLWNTSATTEDLSGIGAGPYNCTVTDANGCTATANASLNDPNAPTVTLSLAMDTICIDDAPYTLSGESPAGGTFSGPGVTAGSFDPITVGIGTHLISYTYTDINGCTGSTTDSIYVDVCTGMSPFYSLETPFSVYPNPNNGAFTLQMNASSAADIMIYDAQGKLVMTQKVQPNVQSKMNIESSGIYLITVITSDGARASQRVIVTRY